MKKYITIAALLAARSAFANAYQIDAEFTTAPTLGGNCWSADYVFEFTLVSIPTQEQIVLGFYRGSAVNDAYGYNAIVLNVLNDNMTLTVGRGRAHDTVNNATGIDFDTTFTFAGADDDKRTFTQEIEKGITYTLTVTGGDQAMTPTLSWDGGSETLTSYKGNMNGNAALTSAVIPEPSAFGLLAGLGALALVGTRRRRR